MEGRGTGERVRVPVGMSDKSTEGEKKGKGGRCIEFGRGVRQRKVGTSKRAQTVAKLQRLKAG